MLELKPNNNIGRLCKHCGYIRHESDHGDSRSCPSCQRTYDARKSTRQRSGHSSLLESCEAHKRNQAATDSKRPGKYSHRRVHKARTVTHSDASTVMKYLAWSVGLVFTAILVKIFL